MYLKAFPPLYNKILKKEAQMKSFKSINLIVLAISITEIPVFSGNILSIEDAAKKGLIKLSIKGKGGYTGDVIEMKIKNLTNKKLDLKVDAGKILDSKKNDEQDLLVVRSQDFFVDAHQLKTINVYGMCCQAHKASPQANSDYTLGKWADTSLIKLACFIDENKQYSNRTAQQAVWTLSDSNSIASISGGEKEIVTLFRKYVSKLTGREIPAYDITYLQESDHHVLGRATKIEGIFEYSVPANGKITIGIYDVSGNLVQLLFKNIPHKKGECKLYYTFRTRNLNSGTYFARMNMDGTVQKEMKIQF